MSMSLQSEFSQIREQAGLDIEEVASLLEVHPRTVRRYEDGTTQPRPIYLRRLRELLEAKNIRSGQAGKFRFVDLFAGIGGLRLAMEAAGGRCVFTSEWDAACRKTYAANFRCDHEIAGDIREYSEKPEIVPEHDVLVGGFPCQPFSIAGVSKLNSLMRDHGFRYAAQGTLFFDVALLIEHHRPAAFLLENVKNLERHDRGKTFQVIMKTLREELGYHVEFRVVNSQSWVPQKRERIFIVGFREDVGFSFDGLTVPDPDAGPRLGSILEDPASVDPKYTLSPKLWKYLQDYKKKHRAAGNGFGYDVFGPEDVTRTLSARYYKDGSEILVDRGARKRPRRLTPRECARLMGFERDGRPEWQIPVSDTQAYKQFGNAVVVQAAEAVALHMKPFIHRAMNLDQPDLLEDVPPISANG
ncbi:DNA (cytosine-5-)-methyltransferase [Roseovarius sp. A46]|nr:DNA (cytosine-5-)-methyltransferase [Roseovarius sp. A46]